MANRRVRTNPTNSYINTCFTDKDGQSICNRRLQYVGSSDRENPHTLRSLRADRGFVVIARIIDGIIVVRSIESWMPNFHVARIKKLCKHLIETRRTYIQSADSFRIHATEVRRILTSDASRLYKSGHVSAAQTIWAQLQSYCTQHALQMPPKVAFLSLWTANG